MAGFVGGSDTKRKAIAAEVAEACSTVGFLYMAGHGLSPALVDDTFAQTERFFAQSEDDPPPHAGHARMVPGLRAHEVGRHGHLPHHAGAAADDPDVVAVASRWHHRQPLAATICPLPRGRDGLPGRDARSFRSISGRCSPSASTCPRISFEPFYKRPLIQQSLLYYPAPPSTDPKDLKSGRASHSDTGAFTILMQDQVWRAGGQAP